MELPSSATADGRVRGSRALVVLENAAHFVVNILSRFLNFAHLSLERGVSSKSNRDFNNCKHKIIQSPILEKTLIRMFVTFVLFTRSMPSTGALTGTLPQLLWLQTRRCAVARAAGCGVWRGNSRTRGGLRGGTPQVAPPVHTRHQTCRPASSSGCVAA